MASFLPQLLHQIIVYYQPQRNLLNGKMHVKCFKIVLGTQFLPILAVIVFMLSVVFYYYFVVAGKRLFT